jgi:hypothetical protein
MMTGRIEGYSEGVEGWKLLGACVLTFSEFLGGLRSERTSTSTS